MLFDSVSVRVHVSYVIRTRYYQYFYIIGTVSFVLYLYFFSSFFSNPNGFIRVFYFFYFLGILKINGEITNVVEANLKTLKIRISESENSDLSDRHQLLELFSPACVQFMHQFGENIEIPGQYIGFSVPVPEKHVKIYNFHERV